MFVLAGQEARGQGWGGSQGCNRGQSHFHGQRLGGAGQAWGYSRGRPNPGYFGGKGSKPVKMSLGIKCEKSVFEVLVKPGDRVEEGQNLQQLHANK